MLFPNFSEDSSVWAYTADRFLTEKEIQKAKHLLADFLVNWKAHGKSLVCDGIFLYNSLLILVVDENSVQATGCSIDSSVHFVKSLEKELNVSFFNRLQLLAKKGDELKFVHYNDSHMESKWQTFDLSLTKMGDLLTKWPL
jgi:hypothetical protein